jgi:hypothetical protein
LQDKQQKDVKEAPESYFYFNDDYNVDSAKVEVSEFIVHPDWDPEDTHYTADIAIAVLEKPVKLTNKIRHVCLNTPLRSDQKFCWKKCLGLWLGIDRRIGICFSIARC